MTVVDARRHAKAVKLDLMHPLRPRGRLFDGRGKLGTDELRKGRLVARPAGLYGLRSRTLNGPRHARPRHERSERSAAQEQIFSDGLVELKLRKWKNLAHA
jgi:hypothetical protein